MYFLIVTSLYGYVIPDLVPNPVEGPELTVNRGILSSKREMTGARFAAVSGMVIGGLVIDRVGPGNQLQHTPCRCTSLLEGDCAATLEGDFSWHVR